MKDLIGQNDLLWNDTFHSQSSTFLLHIRSFFCSTINYLPWILIIYRLVFYFPPIYKLCTVKLEICMVILELCTIGLETLHSWT
jgi:hypothetical protein